MELIIKPTGRCNFNCSFCSANLLDIKHSEKVSDELKHIIETLKPSSLIFTGGDPLMVNRNFYDEILTLGDFNISFTTNLKAFDFDPDKLTDLFKPERVGVCTSFQYGTERKWDINTPYTESKFIEVMNLFNEKIGYMPSFISLVSEENEDRALDHIYLAKQVGTKCKLNAVLKMGLSKEYYPFYKMIDLWLKIQDLGLEEYWDNEIQFKLGGCNFNTNSLCESSIRTFWLDNKGNIKYGNCEDRSSNELFIPMDKEAPKPKKSPLELKNLISSKCLFCHLCRLCNGCKAKLLQNKEDKKFCSEMKKREERILGAGWKL